MTLPPGRAPLRPSAEYARLVREGVRPAVAAVLTAQQPGEDERAYWRAVSHLQEPTPAQRAAHADAQQARRGRQFVRRAEAAAIPRQAPPRP